MDSGGFFSAAAPPGGGDRISAQMAAVEERSFARPWWLFNTHLETVWARGVGEVPDYNREIAKTTDNDRVAFDSLPGRDGRPHLTIFHGLEGCSASHTVRQCAAWFSARGWGVTVPHFRTCGIMNDLPRAYHAGDTADVDWMLRYVGAGLAPGTDHYALGTSLGGNALAKWLGESPGQEIVKAAATVCAPLDLPSCGRRLDTFFNRNTYGRYFIRRLVRKIERKLDRYPFLIGRRELARIRTVREFDDRLTAPMHGFEGVDDYYRKASALPLLEAVATPLLCLHSDNDALIPVPDLPANAHVAHARTRGGGHSGFITGPLPGRSGWLADRIHGFFTET